MDNIVKKHAGSVQAFEIPVVERAQALPTKSKSVEHSDFDYQLRQNLLFGYKPLQDIDYRDQFCLGDCHSAACFRKSTPDTSFAQVKAAHSCVHFPFRNTAV